MSNFREQSRRDFIKLAAAGATTLTIGKLDASTKETGRAGWVNGQPINPAIPNTRVVYCTDPSMIKLNPSKWAFADQNNAIDTANVEPNMDKLAMRLTGKSSAAEAWKTIFMKPAAKSFSEVKAAIKVNCIYISIMPRVAIVGKVCKELIALGVDAGNITIFDSCDGAFGNSKYTPYIGNGLPKDVVVFPTTGGGPQVPVGSGTLQCSPVIAKIGTNGIEYITDILVNCAVNKGHGSSHGSFTMTMKNHTGTLKYKCPEIDNAKNDLIDENKSEAIIGTMGDFAKPPRQQLCIVDSLWAAATGPFKDPSHNPATIAMGTVGPVVDYAVAEHIRKNPKIMNTPYNEKVVNNWLTGFGIEKSKIEWVDALAPVAAHEAWQATGPRVLTVQVRGRGRPLVSFNLPENPGRLHIEILTIDGTLVRRLEPSGSDAGLYTMWDGRLAGGTTAPAGTYVVRLRRGSEAVSRNIRLL